MTENPVAPDRAIKSIDDARANAYRVVSDNDFYPLRPVEVPGTAYAVPEIAAVVVEYLLTGTPSNGISVYFEPGAQMDGNKMTVMSLVVIGIKQLGDDLDLLPLEIIDRICELERLQSAWTASKKQGGRE